MNIVIIIQARMGSTRLPGKVLFPLQGKTVLSHVVERCLAVSNATAVVVATTMNKEDDAIAIECESRGISCFRGSEHDVLNRYFEAAMQFNADIIVRVTSDCPLFDPDLCRDVIEHLIKRPKVLYCSNDLVRSYPRGLDVEAFRMSLLKEANSLAREVHHREHVTPYMYNDRMTDEIFSLRNIEDESKYRWTLDTPEDWMFIQEVYKYLGPENRNFSWKYVIEILSNNQKLKSINAHIQQKDEVLTRFQFGGVR